MAYLDFVSLYAAQNKRPVEELLAEDPPNFALGANARGEALIESLRKSVDIDFSGKRVLDVGCALGGLSVALAMAGAATVGIDTHPKLLAYAEANAFGQANLAIAMHDISDIAIRKHFGAGSFEVIFLNDVLEKHYDIDTLMGNVDYLLSPHGLVYFRTLNGNSLRLILTDPHKKAFGLPLMAPDYWHHFGPRSATVYYRPINTILAQFQFYNMPKRMFIDDENALVHFTERRLARRIQDIYAKSRTAEYPDPAIGKLLRKQATRLRDRYLHDWRRKGEDFAKIKYGTVAYHGFVGRSGAVLSTNLPLVNVPELGMIIRHAPAEVAPTPAVPARRVAVPAAS